eukprot:g31672.t1
MPPTATVVLEELQEEPTILPVPLRLPAEALRAPEPEAPEMEVPTDVPSPTSPAEVEGTMPTVVPFEADAGVLEPTSPASPLAEDTSALEGPPHEARRKRRKMRLEVRGSTPTRWSAPPVPATPTDREVTTPTEDALLVPPQARVASATRYRHCRVSKVPLQAFRLPRWSPTEGMDPQQEPGPKFCAG